MDIFKKEYVLRKFGEQKEIDGYMTAPYIDSVAKLNVQPQSTDEIAVLPEGDRAVKRIKAIGKVEIHTADDFKGIPADRLFYKGKWYECEGSDIRDNTPIGQTSAVFVLITKSESEELLKEPDMEAIKNGDVNDINRT